jgi:hypothetical protein
MAGARYKPHPWGVVERYIQEFPEGPFIEERVATVSAQLALVVGLS